MSERLANWVRMQQRLVDDGTKATHIHLIVKDGIDETTWAIWPIATEKLAWEIQESLTALGQEISTGKHPAKLVALDHNGRQLGLLPQSIHGSAGAKTSAANEAVTHARATAMNVATAEQQLVTMANRAQAAEDRATKMMASFYEMTAVVTRMQHDQVDNDCRRIESQARSEALTRIGEQIAQHAGPLMMLVTDVVAQRMGKTEEPDHESESHHADHSDQPDQPQSAPANGGGSATGNGGRHHARSRKRSAPRQTTEGK